MKKEAKTSYTIHILSRSYVRSVSEEMFEVVWRNESLMIRGLILFQNDPMSHIIIRQSNEDRELVKSILSRLSPSEMLGFDLTPPI